MVSDIEIVELFYKKAISYVCSYFKKNNKFGIELYNLYPLATLNYDYVDDNITNISATISDLYEKSLPSNYKKDLGVFYTNDNKIIEYIVDCIDVLKGKILEPSCGSGAFMTAIAKKIICLLKERKINAIERYDYIQSNLIGNDVDEFACKISELSLIILLIDDLIEIANTDKSISVKKLQFYNNNFIEKGLFSKDFDIIVGNPPFVTQYGKRSRNMNEAKREIYNQFNFVQNKKGNNKFNLSMFFIENGLEILKERGTLCYILDISFFETAFIDIRKFLLENFSIQRITSNLKEFKGVASGQIILEVTNYKDENNIVQWYEFDTKKISNIKQSVWHNDIPKYRFLRPLDDIQERIINKCKCFDRLSYFFPNKALRTCCALTGKTEEFIVNDNELHKDILVFDYLEGSKSIKCKFCNPYPTRKIKYDYDLQIKLSNEFKEELTKLGIKNKKRVTLGDKEAYLAPKIFIRQSAFELIATYTEKPFAANNSIYVLTNKDYSQQGKKFLIYICGLMNSNLLSFYARTTKIIRYEKGKTPQIKISDLKELPICVDNKHFEEIINVSNRLLKEPNEKQLLNALNGLVYKIYNIEKDEINYIETTITNYLLN